LFDKAATEVRSTAGFHGYRDARILIQTGEKTIASKLAVKDRFTCLVNTANLEN